MHKEYATMCEIVQPDRADSFVIIWRKTGLRFPYSLPRERMQLVFSGLMDVLRKGDFEAPNTEDQDFCRGARLADNIINLTRLHDIELRHRDFQIFAKSGEALLPCKIKNKGFVRYGRSNYDGKHYPGRFFVSAKSSDRGDD